MKFFKSLKQAMTIKKMFFVFWLICSKNLMTISIEKIE